MKKEEIKSQKSYPAVGPYSQAIRYGDLLFVSGQIAIDPITNNLIKEDIKAQTKQVFENLKSVLEAGGSDLDSVLKMNVYLTNMNGFPTMNEVYAQSFKKPYPARATVQVCRLPKGALVEIDCIAFINCPPSHKATEGERDSCCGCC